jgi:hypothetical protein
MSYSFMWLFTFYIDILISNIDTNSVSAGTRTNFQRKTKRLAPLVLMIRSYKIQIAHLPYNNTVSGHHVSTHVRPSSVSRRMRIFRGVGGGEWIPPQVAAESKRHQNEYHK